MVDRHLDLGCGGNPRNPYGRTIVYGVDINPGISDKATIVKSDAVTGDLPFGNGYFASVSAFDFLEHVPRSAFLSDLNGQNRTVFPFIHVMNEIWRVLEHEGRLYALTPAYPHGAAFGDPTHVNFITSGTHKYFCGEHPMGRMYGFEGRFRKIRSSWVKPEWHFGAQPLSISRALRSILMKPLGRLSHIVWELEAIKSK